MGRESRQARRQRQRKQQQKHSQFGMSRGMILGGAGVIVAVLIVLIALLLHSNSGPQVANANNTNSFRTSGPSIDGIGCGAGMQSPVIHVHQHIAIYDGDKLEQVPAFVGFNINDNCLYWLHTHEESPDIIHLEAPHKMTPGLGQFFDVWHQPLSRSQVWKFHVKPGEKMLVYVNGKVWTGDPRKIPLIRHQVIQIDVGPPYKPFQPYTFAGGL